MRLLAEDVSTQQTDYFFRLAFLLDFRAVFLVADFDLVFLLAFFAMLPS
jgi:hypothetical protein